MSRLIRRVNPTTGVNPYAIANVADIGDAKINMMSLEQSIDNITDFVAEATAEGAAPVAVGGDHTIPLPIFRGMRKSGYAKDALAVVHVDAHADTFDSLGESMALGLEPLSNQDRAIREDRQGKRHRYPRDASSAGRW
jgi:guanidinopropionase